MMHNRAGVSISSHRDPASTGALMPTTLVQWALNCGNLISAVARKRVMPCCASSAADIHSEYTVRVWARNCGCQHLRSSCVRGQLSLSWTAKAGDQQAFVCECRVSPGADRQVAPCCCSKLFTQALAASVCECHCSAQATKQHLQHRRHGSQRLQAHRQPSKYHGLDGCAARSSC